MTAEEFKKLKPEYSHLTGEDLLNAMEGYYVRLSQGYEVTKIVLPFWKRYTFRWFFYRRLTNSFFRKADYTCKERCAFCKKPVGTKMGFMLEGRLYFNCEFCWKALVLESNVNIDHRLYKIGSAFAKGFWWALDKIHLVRSSYYGRYDIFGDEDRYIEYYGCDSETGKVRIVLRGRKWWEHIFIERKFNPKIK